MKNKYSLFKALFKKLWQTSLNSKGQGLIHVLVAISILGITMMSFLDFQTTQQRELKALSEKMGALSLKNVLLNVLSNQSVCTFELLNSTTQTFDMSSAAAIASATIPINQIHLKNNSTSPVVVEVSSVKPAVPDSKSLFVNSIKLTNFVGSAGNFTAEWLISFDSSKLVRGLKPISIPTAVKVDMTTPSAAKIINCGEAQAPETLTGTNPTCPTGKTVILRRWTTPGCSNYGNYCTLYQGWNGAPPSCESCVDWEKCHICYSSSWNAVQCQ